MGKLMFSCSPCEDLPWPLSIQDPSGVWCDFFFFLLEGCCVFLTAVLFSPSAQRERSPSPPGHNPPTPQSTDSQPALSDISTTTPTPTAPTATPAPTPTPTPKRRRHPDMDCISYQSQSLRRSTRNTSGGERPAEGSSGGTVCFFCFVFFISAMNQLWISFFFYFKYVNLTRLPN